MSYTVKPQTPLMLGENFIYPLTAADQVVVGAGTENERRLEVDGKVEADHAVNAENAVNAESAVKADNADNASLLGGKEPKYYIQPRNLLDNSDFTNLITQAGLNGYHGAEHYLADRWQSAGDVNGIQNSSGCTLISHTDFGYIFQRTSGTAGKRLTAAICYTCPEDEKIEFAVWDHALESSYVTMMLQAGTNRVAVLPIDNLPSDANILIYSLVNVEMEVHWAALYEGEYTTENLPPYMPKGYGAELMECMRYFQRIVGYDYSILSNGFWFTSTSFRTAMPISFPMRSKPAISMDLSRFQVVSSGATQLAPLKVDLVNQSGSTVSLSIETASNTQGLAGMLRASVSSQYSYIDLSADL